MVLCLTCQGSLVSTLREVQPHMLFGVPRVWEKIQQNMENVSQSAPALKRRIARWARRIGLKANYGFLKRFACDTFCLL